MMDALKAKFPDLSDFSMFLIDEDSGEKQLYLLSALLEDITSPKPWFECISYLQKSCGIQVTLSMSLKIRLAIDMSFSSISVFHCLC